MYPAVANVVRLATDTCTSMGMVYIVFKRASTLFVIRRHLIVNVAYQGYAHLRCVVASQNITDEMCFNLHVDLYLR